MNKLYTEEQVKAAYNMGYIDAQVNHINDAEQYTAALIAIELPTDEEIVKQSKHIAHNYFEMHHANHYQGLEEGSLRMASWMKEQIQGGNK